MGKLNRVGEEGINNFGSKMIITKYNAFNDMEVYFPEYNWKAKHVQYGNFKIGNVKCPYEPRVYRVAYIGAGKYKPKENGRTTKCYEVWKNMLTRCYDAEYKKREPTYQGCEVCEEWHNFQTFSEWFHKNYYEIPNEIMCLDKDILNKGNKIYSPETCVFVPKNINNLFTKRNNDRGNYPIGVYYKKNINKFIAQCSDIDDYGRKQRTYLGVFDNDKDAFKAYKSHKEKIIKETIDTYEGIIPEPTYSKLKNVMYNYKVEIND